MNPDCAGCGHSWVTHDITTKGKLCSRFDRNGRCKCEGYVPAGGNG